MFGKLPKNQNNSAILHRQKLSRKFLLDYNGNSKIQTSKKFENICIAKTLGIAVNEAVPFRSNRATSFHESR